MTAIQDKRVLAAMRDPSFYPRKPKEVEVIETHISTVFIAGDRVYKVKKDLTLPFVDYGSLDRRRHFCHEEVRLNGRLAPDAYLGVRSIVRRNNGFELAEADENQSAVEYAVEMRRLPTDRSLDRLLAAGPLTPELVGQVARRIATFHGEAALAPDQYGGVAAVKARMDENLQATLPWVGSAIDRHTFNAVERFFDAFALSKRELLAERTARGRTREGHGDLRAEHVVIENGKLTIYDCVEFAEDLRYMDVASDLAFLYMDLERLGASGLAIALERAYIEQSQDEEVHELLPFFACYRAWVRIKIACLKLEGLEDGSPDRAALLSEVRSLAALSLRFVWQARLPLVLVFCGVGASGKSTLADRITSESGLHHLSSDVIRKGLTGIPLSERGPQTLYDEGSTMQTYDDLLVEALEITDASRGVVVDATFGKRHRRKALADAIQASGARVLFCECRAPEGVLRERAAARELAPERGSDATWTIIEQQMESFEPLDEVPARNHLVLRTDRPLVETLDDVEAFVSRAVEGGM
jgi:aminoglycoside phosphotransferase family enzyme/predicted kinase